MGKSKGKCIICGEDEYAPLLHVEDYRYHLSDEKFSLVQCCGCGWIYLNPMPTEDKIKKLYPKEYWDFRYSKIKQMIADLLFKARIKKIRKYKKGGKVLDVGCGTGEFLSSLQKIRYHCYGVDISEEACKKAKKKNSLIFNNNLKECKFPDSFFDIITLNHTLHQVLNPNDELKEIHRVLKGDSILYILVPNADSYQFKIAKEAWFCLDPPRHIYHFTPDTQRMLLEKNRFKIIEISYPLYDLPLDLFHSLEMTLFDRRPAFVKIFLRPFLLIVSSTLKLLSPRWRGTMEIIAQKS
jgi:ubiquinone/menaquinone biosynthesis C-methylase UbiE